MRTRMAELNLTEHHIPYWADFHTIETQFKDGIWAIYAVDEYGGRVHVADAYGRDSMHHAVAIYRDQIEIARNPR